MDAGNNFVVILVKLAGKSPVPYVVGHSLKRFMGNGGPFTIAATRLFVRLGQDHIGFIAFVSEKNDDRPLMIDPQSNVSVQGGELECLRYLFRASTAAF